MATPGGQFPAAPPEEPLTAWHSSGMLRVFTQIQTLIGTSTTGCAIAVNRIGRTQMANQPLESFLADYVRSTFTLNGLVVHAKKQKDCMIIYIYWK